MKLRLETARLLLYKVAWLVERGRPAMLEAALLKLYLSEAFVESGLNVDPDTIVSLAEHARSLKGRGRLR